MPIRLYLILFTLTCHTAVWAKDDAVKQLKNVTSEIQTLSDDLTRNKASKSALFKQLKQQSQSVSNLNRELLQLNRQIALQADELKQLESQQKQQKQLYTQQIDALNKQIRAAYISNQPSFLKVLLSQHDPATLSRNTTYDHYFHQARQQQLVEINTILQNLSDDQKLLFAAQKQQQQLYTQHQQKQGRLKDQTQQRLATIQQLDKKIASQGSKLALLREQQQSLQSLVHSLDTPTNNTKTSVNFAKQAGSLPWPIKGKVLARYGSPRNIGTLTWQGILIAAPAGQNVVATAPGQIVFADWLRGFGQLIIIDHGNQYMTLYGNNDTLLKQVGDNVGAGELIAQSGDKGLHQHAGLYFEVRHKGNPINPLKWLGKQG